MQELTKDAARGLIRERLKAMTALERQSKSDIIEDNIIGSGILDGVRRVLLYKALPTEVNVDRLISYCKGLGAEVYLPRVNGETMEIVQCNGEFSSGAFGILEPIGGSVQVDIDLAIIPLLGIDNRLNRLGKGKGYYDKFLTDSTAFKVAVAFFEQVLDNFAVDKHDIAMDVCYTDLAVIHKGQ